MANAQQLLDEACTSGIACLEPGQQSIAIAQALASFLGMNARELIDAACASGIDCLEPGQLATVTAEGIRQIAAAGGVGGGTMQVFSPVPAAPGNGETQGYLAFPTGGGNLLQWDGANWV